MGLPWLLILSVLTACGGEYELGEALPGEGDVAGWIPTGEVQLFNAENLFDLVDGQADSYYAYAFEQAAVQSYENGSGATVRVEIWQVGTPADAYGLFTTYRSGEHVAVGNDGDSDPGRRLDFWQDRYFVRLFGLSPLADEVLQTFAWAVAGALPTGGEPPALVARLPREDLVEGSHIFFHQEISIQDHLWLGGQNLLALGPETDAVLARYEIEGESAWFLLVEYPTAGAASVALDALQVSGIHSLAAAHAREERLGAVFGPVTEAQALSLLRKGLGE
jgi:hypothetical protein